MKSSNQKKKNFHLNFFIFQFTRERIKLPKRFWHHSTCFQIIHIVSKFQFFIYISIVVKLKNKIQNGPVFATFSMLHIYNWTFGWLSYRKWKIESLFFELFAISVSFDLFKKVLNSRVGPHLFQWEGVLLVCDILVFLELKCSSCW